jgi:2-polyprenyl-3-methyl-5-hydroxy-6-metoxy-1,4-benzoquinol methylase
VDDERLYSLGLGMGMTLQPSINCKCSCERSQNVLEFSKKPEGETDFRFGNSDYRRAFDECIGCGHYFARHNLPLAKIYESEYVDATYGDFGGMVARLNRILSLPAEESDNCGRVQRLEAFARETQNSVIPANRNKTLLDIGAGLGVFPAAMKEKDWDVTAVEPDLRTVELLKSIVGVNAFQDDFLALSPERIGQFDFITFNKVLEHLENPSELLSHAKEFLPASGFCYIEVPDVAAARLGKSREEFFVEHHHVFSPASLAIMAENCGFKVLSMGRIVEPSGKFTLYAFLGKATAESLGG